MFKVNKSMSLRDAVAEANAADPNWHRGYYIVRHLSNYILVILQADSKTYEIAHVTVQEGSRNVSRLFLHKNFQRQNSELLAAGWKQGPIGPVCDLLKLLDKISVMDIHHSGVFFVYVVYFLLLDAPVYFDAKDPKLRESLAYYCIKGNLPF